MKITKHVVSKSYAALLSVVRGGNGSAAPYVSEGHGLRRGHLEVTKSEVHHLFKRISVQLRILRVI